jgi:AcrR family transcriptional regulator
LFECFRTGLDQIKAALTELDGEHGPARDRLIALVRRYAEAIAGEFGWCMVRAEDQDLSPAMSKRIQALKSEIDQGIRRLIKEGIDDGSIRGCDPKMTAFALAGALNWISHWYAQDDSLGPSEIADRFSEFFDNGLRPR